MSKSFAWKIAIFIAFSIGLWITFIAIKPAPDWRKGELFVAIPPAGMDVEAAFELELATLFAQHLHLKLKPLAMDYDRVAHALDTHKVHLAAVGMRSSEKSTLRFGTPYLTLSEEVVCTDDSPQSLKDLTKRTLSVMAESTQENTLRAMLETEPGLRWEARHHESVSALLQEVAEGTLDCTVANEEQIALARNFYPQLGDTLDLRSPSRLAWVFPADTDPELYDAAQIFFDSIKKDGTLSRLIDHHYGHNDRLETVDAVAFVSKTRTALPHYKRWFEEASALTGIEWQLLAALAYQESHWDPHATSYTNVRGMMMLTEDTADRMNVDDRLDARTSIIAGAKYLQLLKEALPERIDDQERTWMAMAAYNQGMGHLEDARVLAVKAGLNPDVWSDVRKVMPLLSRPTYYEQSKHGQARGGEAVILVETVRLYHDMLKRLASDAMPRLPPSPYLGLQPSHPKIPSLR